MTKSLIMALIFTGMSVTAMAAESPSLERGKELFTSSALGTNGRSCATCHNNGKGLEDIGDIPDGKLQIIINQCIQKALKGKALATDSSDQKALAAYVRSLVPAAPAQ